MRNKKVIHIDRYKFRAWHKKERKMYHNIQLQRTLGVDSISDCHDESLDEYPIWMQFIGFKDKNNKEVYEKDIIEDGFGDVGIVTWDKYDCSFILKCPTINKVFNADMKHHYKIIGNKFENPKLYEKVNRQYITTHHTQEKKI